MPTRTPLHATKGERELRAQVVWRLSHWTMIWVIGLYLTGGWYWQGIPEAMRANSAVALFSQQFSEWRGNNMIILFWTFAPASVSHATEDGKCYER